MLLDDIVGKEYTLFDLELELESEVEGSDFILNEVIQTDKNKYEVPFSADVDGQEINLVVHCEGEDGFDNNDIYCFRQNKFKVLSINKK